MAIPIHVKYARELRKSQTPEEKTVWAALRNRKLMNLKFTRQYPITIASTPDKRVFFIADFYCHTLRLIIEIDGEIHLFQETYDKARDQVLNELGFVIMRIPNTDISTNFEGVVDKIKMAVESLKKKQKNERL
jgi:very-short-patch-repair endonuclease